MAVQLGLSRTTHRGLGLRHDEEERRHEERRAHPRATRDRRRAERRRARLRSLIFTGLALALPHQLKQRPLSLLSSSHLSGPGPRVSTSIDSIVPISPSKAYETIIQEAAALYRVDPALIRSVMHAESGFDPSAVSRAGAMGLMQLMPEVAEALGVEHPFDPRENIMAGARLLRELLDLYRGNLRLAIASYNAGPAAIANYGGVVPPFRETQGYVKKVTGLIADARHAGNNDD
jgi:soluble lytic murein transglycosylase-like protein